MSSHLCCPHPPSCRRTGGLSAGSVLRLAMLPTALPSTARPLLPQTSAVQADPARRTRTQTGQLRLHPAPLEKCNWMIILGFVIYTSPFSDFVAVFSVSEESIICSILFMEHLQFIPYIPLGQCIKLFVIHTHVLLSPSQLVDCAYILCYTTEKEVRYTSPELTASCWLTRQFILWHWLEQ